MPRSDLSPSAAQLARLVQSLPAGQYSVSVNKSHAGLHWSLDTVSTGTVSAVDNGTDSGDNTGTSQEAAFGPSHTREQP